MTRNDERSKTPHFYRCLEVAHSFEECRDPHGPLVLRQSAWCTTHDSPAVYEGDPADVDETDATKAQAPAS